MAASPPPSDAALCAQPGDDTSDSPLPTGAKRPMVEQGGREDLTQHLPQATGDLGGIIAQAVSTALAQALPSVMQQCMTACLTRRF